MADTKNIFDLFSDQSSQKYPNIHQDQMCKNHCTLLTSPKH